MSVFSLCRSWMPCVAVVLSFLSTNASSVAAPASRQKPYTIERGIEMTVIDDPLLLHFGNDANNVKFSGDGSKFSVVVRKGNLQTGNNDYRLLVFDAAAVRAGIASPGLPQPVVAATFSSSSNRPGIADVRWLPDNRTLAFLAENPGESSQVYTVGLDGQAPRRRTNHPTSVLDFDLNMKTDTVIYSAETPLDWTERNAHGFAVGVEFIGDLASDGRKPLLTRLAFYIARKGDATRRVALDPYEAHGQGYGMWLSPTGRWAVALSYVANPPARWWTGYKPLAGEAAVAGGGEAEALTYTKPHPQTFLQYVLIDTQTGKATPLIDAPANFTFRGGEHDAAWLPDESAVVVSNTFLPLNAPDPNVSAKNGASAAVAEIDLGTRTPRRIADVAGGDQSVIGMKIDGAGNLVIRRRSKTPLTAFAKRDNDWAAIPSDNVVPPLSVSIAQGLNRPPDLLATDVVTGVSKTITDFNPQFRQLSMGTVEVVQWTDANKRTWTGGLIKPIGYMPGKRYPLVIQTHGFMPERFFLDGPADTSGYGGRALANRGIMVVQVPDATPRGTRAELLENRAGYVALIDKLDREGLIDRSKIGIQGFSRTGYYVQDAITFSGIDFAAASVTDPSGLSAASYGSYFGFRYPGMQEYEKMLGVPLWGDENAKIWAERDPSFHNDQITAPLRIEAYTYMIGPWWETYTNLRRHQRPAEFLYFPNGAHQLMRPWERLTSQGGTVDWYDFWLNGHEDPDPAKAEQYVRWHKLRLERDAAKAGAHGAN